MAAGVKILFGLKGASMTDEGRIDVSDGVLSATFPPSRPSMAPQRLVRGSQQATLPRAMSGSGARYVGDGIEFWNKGRDAMVEWQGHNLECSEAESPAS